MNQVISPGAGCYLMEKPLQFVNALFSGGNTEKENGSFSQMGN